MASRVDSLRTELDTLREAAGEEEDRERKHNYEMAWDRERAKLEKAIRVLENAQASQRKDLRLMERRHSVAVEGIQREIEKLKDNMLEKDKEIRLQVMTVNK